MHAEQIKEPLKSEIQEELGYAQQFAARIKELYGVVPGSEGFKSTQRSLQTPRAQAGAVHVVSGYRG